MTQAFSSFQNDYSQARAAYFASIANQTAVNAATMDATNAFKLYTTQRVSLLGQQLISSFLQSPLGTARTNGQPNSLKQLISTKIIDPNSMNAKDGQPAGLLNQSLVGSIPSVGASASTASLYSLSQDNAIASAQATVINGVNILKNADFGNFKPHNTINNGHRSFGLARSVPTYGDTLAMSSRKTTSVARGPIECLDRRPLLSLTVLPETITAATQVPFSGEVAGVIDTSDLNPQPTDFTATINWGDGNTTAGQVVSLAVPVPNVFEIDGTHTYTQGGTLTTTISVTGPNGQTASQHGTAIVTAAPLTIAANAVTGKAGVAIPNATVATFLDPNTTGTADFNALISWGDGHSSAGTVQGSNGVFTVTGSNTYFAAGTFSFTVTVVGAGGSLSSSATGQATIAPSPPYTLTSRQIVATVGQPLVNATVASFTDPNNGSAGTNNDSASIFTASINWGDGHTTAGVVQGATGTFNILGSYTYTVPGTYSVAVTLGDQSGRTATTTGTALVTNTPSAPNFNFTGGLALVATNGSKAVFGITNNNRPEFSGTAPPFSIVQLNAGPTAVDATLSLGQAIASATGQWTLTANPLANGTYFVTATVTPPGSYPQFTTSLTANSGVVVIHASRPHVVAETTHHKTHRASVKHHHG